MRKGRYRRIAVWAWALICALLLGCAAERETGGHIADVERPSAPESRSYPSGDTSPLEIQRDASEGYIFYPKALSGSHADKINRKICEEVESLVTDMALDKSRLLTEYRVEHNGEGLFSIVLSIRDLAADELLAVLPLTFDCASGELCTVDYFFPAADERWREAVGELATQKAEAAGLTLLRDLSPIEDGQPYYIAEKSLVLQYRPYEAATYAAGWPQIEIPVETIRSYLAPGSPLNRLPA